MRVLYWKKKYEVHILQHKFSTWWISCLIIHRYINSFHFQVQTTFIIFVLLFAISSHFSPFFVFGIFQMTNGEQETLNAFGHVFWPIICLEVGLLTWDYGKARTWTRRYNDVNKVNRNWVSNMNTANDIIYPVTLGSLESNNTLKY